MNIEHATLASASASSETAEVFYVDKDAQRIPDWILHKHALTAETLDLSWNCLTTLSGLDNLVRYV